MKYQVGRQDANKMFPKVYAGRSAAVKALKQRARKAAPNAQWFWKRQGQPFRGPEPLDPAAAALEALAAGKAKNADLDAFLFSNKKGVTLILKEVIPGDELADPYPGSVGFWHPKIVQAYRIVFGDADLRGKTTFLGAYNCRRMRGSSAWSMHSNWPPVLAIDIGHAVSDAGRQVADEIVRVLKARIDGLVFVTYRDNSDHANHVHVQVGSNRSGTPECA